jgi:hypothetical protein
MGQDTFSPRTSSACDKRALGSTILHRLRHRGCSKGQSMGVLAGLQELGPSRLLRAKALVHDSPVWADAKDRDEQLFDEAENSS